MTPPQTERSGDSTAYPHAGVSVVGCTADRPRGYHQFTSKLPWICTCCHMKHTRLYFALLLRGICVCVICGVYFTPIMSLWHHCSPSKRHLSGSTANANRASCSGYSSLNHMQLNVHCFVAARKCELSAGFLFMIRGLVTGVRHMASGAQRWICDAPRETGLSPFCSGFWSVFKHVSIDIIAALTGSAS